MKQRGAISLVFDDGYTAIFDQVVPLLEQYGFKGVFAIPLETDKVAQTEGRPVTAWPQWVELKQRGHEIAGHSITHRNLTKLTVDELKDELRQPAEQLQATTLVYPGGAFNQVVSQTAAQYYQAARTVQKGFATLPPTNKYELPTFNFTKDNFSLWKANALALWAHITNSWLIETYHLVGDPDPAVMHNVPLAEFKKHLQFIKGLAIRVGTIEEII